MSPASRISVEIAGDSASLQAAVSKAADSLKGLGDTLLKQMDVADKAGKSTIGMNESIGKSFDGVAAKAKQSVGVQVEQLSLFGEALKEQAGQMEMFAFKEEEMFAGVAEAAVASAAKTKEALAEQAAAARKSSEEQVSASDETALASKRAADTHVTSAKKAEQAFGSSSSAISKAGKIITLGLIGAAAASVDLAVKFESNTTRLQTQAGATAKQVDALRKGMLAMAQQVGYTPDQLANGMYHVVSSMTAAQRATMGTAGELHILADAAKLAQVGHSNLEDTTYALVSALQALHLPLSDLGQLTGQVNAIVGAGDMTMTDFVESLKSGLLPAARTAGISLQSVGAAMDAMGDQGMRGSLAGTRLRMSIALLSSPSAAAAKVLDTLGLSSKEATSKSAAMAAALQQAGLRTTTLSADLRKPDGISYALEDLKKHLVESGLTATGAAAVMNKAFGGGRMGATITLLEDNLGRVDSKFTQIGKGGKAFGHDWQVQTQTAAQQLHDIEGGLAAVATRLGTDLLPDVKEGVHDFSDFVGWLEKGSKGAHDLELAVGTLATVAIGSYLVSKLKTAITLFKELRGFVNSPFGLLGAKTAGGGAPLATGGLGAAAGGMGIGGAKSGYGLPGSLANPLIVAIEAGEYAGLGSMGASGTVGTEQKVAAVESGAVETSGLAAPAVAGGIGTEVEAGLAATVVGGLKTAVGSLLKGGLIAGGGMAVSKLAGTAIGGSTGKAVSDVGTGASVGAGIGSIIPGVGTLAGAVTGALAGGFVDFINTDEDKYGNQMADRLRKALGSAAPEGLVDAYKKAVQHAQDISTRRATEPTPGGGTATIIPGRSANPNGTPSSVNPKQDAAAWAAAGVKAGDAFIAGEKSVKFPSTDQVFQSVSNSLEALPAKARNAAAETMLAYANTLQQQGKLPQGAVAELITNLETEFPGLSTYLHSQGMSMASDFAATMKMSTAVSNTQNLVGTLTTDFGNIFQTGKLNSGNLLTSVTSDFQTLRDNMGEMTHAGRVAAEAELGALRDTATHDAATMAQNVTGQISQMSSAIVSDTSGAVTKASGLYSNLVTNIEGSITSGTVTTKAGMKDIGDSLNVMLKAFGEPKIDFTGIGASPGAGGASKSTLVANSKAAAKKATGGWIGAPGEKGRDSVLTVLGKGEAVLKHQDQAIVNGALAGTPYGSLAGVFSATAGQKHYMASGGFAGTPTISGARESYSQLEGLWDQAGGPAPLAPLAAAIALAESGGDPTIVNSIGASGLWQIHPGEPGDLNPLQNARDAVSKWLNAPGGGRNFSPWVTYTTGAYKQYLKGGVPASAGAIGGSGQITIPNVTGTGPVADIVQGALNTAGAGANSILGALAANVAGGAGGGGAIATAGLPSGAGFTPSQLGTFDGLQVAKWIIPELTWARQHGWGGRVDSGWRSPTQVVKGVFATAPQGQSEHQYDIYPGGAVDVSDYQQFAQIIQGYTGADKLIQLGIDPLHFSGTGHAGGGFVRGFDAGGFTDDAKFTNKVIKPATVKTKNPTKAKQTGKGVSTKDLQELSQIGGRIGDIEQDLTNKLAQYSALSGQFSVTEGSPQFLNADGTINAAGIQQATTDNSTLLGLANAIYQDYTTELPLVSAQLTKFLGKQSTTQSTITADKAKVTTNKNVIAQNKLKEASLRKGLLDLTKPTKNVVQTIEDQIKKAKLSYSGQILAAEKRKLSYDESTLPRELSLEDAVIKAEKAKLGYSAVTTADGLKQQVLSAEAREKGYTGSDAVTKDQRSNAVNAARNAYSEFLLGQAPIKAALTAAGSNASLALRQYVQDEKPTQDQLTNAIATDRLSEQSAVQPLEEALYNAQIAQQKRQQQVKTKSFNLRQQLNTLTNQDLKLSTTDSGISNTITSLKSVLAGAGGGTTGVNTTVSTLETVASNLGTIQWNGGVFAGINTADQGAAFNEQTTIDSLNNTLQTLGSEATGTTSSTLDQTAQIQLEQQLALQISEGNALSQSLGAALTGFLPMVGAVEIPHYSEGGPILQDGPIFAHAGEHVVPAHGTLVANGGGQPVVHVHNHIHGDASGIIKAVRSEIRNPENVRAAEKVSGARTRMLRGPQQWGRH